MHNLATTRVAERVRTAMRERGIVQTALAAELGRSQTAISRRLTGEVPFDVNELDDIARVLGVDVVDLMPGAGQVAS